MHPATLLTADQSSEASALMSELSRRSSNEFQHLGTTGDGSSTSDVLRNQALSYPPSQCSWDGLDALVQYDSETGLQRWKDIKQSAKEELESGHRAATANEGTMSASPYQRAQFLAVRDSLSDQWQPQNGIELALIDMMAQAYSAQLFWQERMMCYSCLEAETGHLKKGGFGYHPRVTDSQAVDQAAQMVDRFNRIFMRSLRALRDLRRHAPTLVVHNAQQVNVAQNQLNVEGT